MLGDLSRGPTASLCSFAPVEPPCSNIVPVCLSPSTFAHKKSQKKVKGQLSYNMVYFLTNFLAVSNILGGGTFLPTLPNKHIVVINTEMLTLEIDPRKNALSG